MNNTQRAAAGLAGGSIGLVVLLAALPLLALMVLLLCLPFMFLYYLGGWTMVILFVLVPAAIVCFVGFAFRR